MTLILIKSDYFPTLNQPLLFCHRCFPVVCQILLGLLLRLSEEISDLFSEVLRPISQRIPIALQTSSAGFPTSRQRFSQVFTHIIYTIFQ